MEEWFSIIIRAGLTPNQVYLLSSMKRKVSPALINIHAELRALVNAGWVDDKNKLATKSLMLLEELDSLFLARKKKATVSTAEPGFIGYMHKYVEIFPDIKLPSDKRARVNVLNLESAFKWFFQKYDYDWDTILKATELYVDEYARNDYKFMRNSQFFIRKQQPDKSWISDLADYCEMVQSGHKDEGEIHIPEKVN